LRLLLSGSADPTISTQMQSFARLVAIRWMDAGDTNARMQLLNELSDFWQGLTTTICCVLAPTRRW